MYKVEITTPKGRIIIYLENLLKLEDELANYPENEKVEATKILKK